MIIALIGATGTVGSAVLEELLRRGHKVKALQRDTGRLSSRENLEVVQCNAMDPHQVETAVKGSDMVVSAFNAGWTNPNLYEDFMTGSRAILTGTKAASVPRLLVVGGAGSLYDDEGRQLVDLPSFPESVRPGASAARDTLVELQRETDLNWTLVSPPPGFGANNPQDRTGKYRLGLDHPLNTNGGIGTISAPDLAVAIVDEVESNAHSRRRFTVAY